ncbi:carboxypeptidase N subunit 2 [Anabrus simplex]|uniref:carboxypeptidase N subunit 2 n=1 Tax=Anabrus simplex TaxID=316456 RepID=UPI0035A2916B
MIHKLFLLLCVVLQLCAANEECQKFLASHPQPIKSDFRGNKELIFSHFFTHDRDYELVNVIRFQVISIEYESIEKTALCVGFVDTTSYTNLKSMSKNPIAWVTMNTDAAVPTGIVEVNGECWALQKDVVQCDPVFFPMPGVMKTPLYVYSPLSAEFWPLLNDEKLFARNWVWRMNTMSKEVKFPSSWVPNLKIRSIKELQIIGNDWGKIETFLSPLPILGRLDLTENNIQELAPDVLLNAPRLREVLFARNNLSLFPQNLDRLTRLNLLDITNPLGNSELTISASDISTIKGVETFGLENINLNTNVTGLLSLQKMKFLNLSGCRISHIDDINPEVGVLADEKSLTVLDLSNNKLSALPFRLFSTLKKLRSLRLHRNKFNTCPADILEHLHDLNYLDLSRNLISDVNKFCFQSVSKKLEYLDLSGNQISHIPEKTFQTLHSLKTLKLSNNALTMIPPLILSGRGTPIQLLDISHNHLSGWDVNSPINILNLSNNKITKFSTQTFRNLNRSKEVDLGGNTFDCCDENLILLKDWMRYTQVDVKNLGTKDLLVCSFPGQNQKYSIMKFKDEYEICQDSKLVFVIVDVHHIWTVPTLLVIIGVLIAASIILITTFLVVFKYYRNTQTVKKVDTLA